MKSILKNNIMGNRIEIKLVIELAANFWDVDQRTMQNIRLIELPMNNGAKSKLYWGSGALIKERHEHIEN